MASTERSLKTCLCFIVVKSDLIVKATLDLLVDLRPHPHLWSRALAGDRKNEIVDASGGYELTLKGGWPLP